MSVEGLIKSWYEDFETHKNELKKYSDLKLLSINEIVEKIEHGDKDFSGFRIVGVD